MHRNYASLELGFRKITNNKMACKSKFDKNYDQNLKLQIKKATQVMLLHVFSVYWLNL